MAMLQVLKSREDGFSPLSQRESLDSGEGPANVTAETNKAA